MAKNEAKIKFTAETKSFNDEIKKSSDELSKLRAETKLNDEEMKTAGVSAEGLQKKQKLLGEQLSATQNKTEALNQKLNTAVEIFGENSAEATRLERQLANSKAEEEKLKQAISLCNSEMQQQASASREAETATGQLTDKIDEQESELSRLKKEYVEVVLKFGDTSDEAQDLATEITSLSGDLKKNKSALSDAASKADDLDQSLDGAGDSADDAGDGFTVLKGTVADLASQAIQAAIGKLTEFVGWLRELPEATREIRQDMATLETSFDSANLTVEQGQDTWKELYKIFGEDDRAVEAANLIAKISDNQKDLNNWVTITTGVYGRFQDSLPVEGLAEASLETAKVGQVTGVLADALNWSAKEGETFGVKLKANTEANKEWNEAVKEATSAEEFFNLALQECSTEQERQQLITDTLMGLYSGSADTYREATAGQMEAKEATAENILAQNDLATAIEPVTTKWDGLKSKLTTAVIPAAEKVSEVMLGALDWMERHPVAMKVIAAVLGVVAVALTALTVVVIAYTVAQWAMNSAILANPITWIIVGIVAAIAAVVAIIVLVIEYWDQIVAAVKSAAEKIKSALSAAWEWIKGIFSTVAEWVNTNVIQPVVNFFTGLWTSIQNIWNTIVNVIKVAVMAVGAFFSAAFNIITLPFRFIWENCKDTVIKVWNAIKSAVQTAINAVKTVITNVLTAIRNFITPILNTIKSVFTTVWNGIKTAVTNVVNGIKNTISSVWNTIKTATTTAFNAVKNTATTVWNAVKNAVMTPVNAVKTTVTNVWNSIKTATSTAFNAVKNTATTVFNNVKTAITRPIEEAKNKVKGFIDAIKGFFSSLSLKLPHIKLPHFRVSGTLSINPPSVPKLSIDWYKDGAIMMKPTIFGINGNSLMAGGEAGAEAIAPIDKLQGYVTDAVSRVMTNLNLQPIADAIEDLAERPIDFYVNGKKFMSATASDGDSVNGLRTSFKNRGLAIE